MLDMKFIRDQLDQVEQRLASRGGEQSLAGFRQLDERRRSLLTESGSVLEASMLRDIERSNRTEAEFTLGDLVERARVYGINAHCLRLAYTHMQAYEIRRQSL